MTGRKPGEGSETEDVSESMEYEEIVTAIMGRRRFGKACGRQVAEELLARLNCPERGMRVIHIAGTNGKGSTAAFVSSILQAAGFCVGQFTSPDSGKRQTDFPGGRGAAGTAALRSAHGAGMHDVRPVPGNGASLFPGAAL